MPESPEKYKVIREYKGLYDSEELLRRIIRRHIGAEYERSAQEQEVSHYAGDDR